VAYYLSKYEEPSIMTKTQTFALYSQESNWERWPEREYSLLSDREVSNLPDEYSSMWRLEYLTKEDIQRDLQGLAAAGNWTAEQVLAQL
jgi:hypothetical protein